MSHRTILIDGDIIVYQQASLHQTDVEWSEGITSTLTFDGQAQKAALDQVERYIELLKADAAIVCLSDAKRNWRKKVFPEYKANRKNVARPILYDRMREILADRYEVSQLPWLEADDLMGLMSTDHSLVKGEAIIVSIDKDMRTVPGKLFNPRKADLGVQQISEEEADLAFYMQVLTGDPTDGYYGVKGIGPKKAEKILLEAEETHQGFWRAIVQAYEAAGMTEGDALVMARVARIIRKGEYDMDTKTVTLWKPKK